MLNKFASQCGRCSKRVEPGEGELRGGPPSSAWVTICSNCLNQPVLPIDLIRSEESLEIGELCIDANVLNDTSFLRIKSIFDTMKSHGVHKEKGNYKVFAVPLNNISTVIQILQSEGFDFSLTPAAKAAIEEKKQEIEEAFELAKLHLDVMEKKLGSFWERVGLEVSGKPWKLRNYQREAVIYLRSNPDGMLLDQMGCVSGDALIQINRGGRSRKYKLRDVFERFEKKWDSKIPTFTRSEHDGLMGLNKIENVLSKGIKDVVKVSLESGKEIVVTLDHELLTPNGWVPASKLNQGDIVFVNGNSICNSCGSDENVVTGKYSKFRGYCKKCIYTKLRRDNGDVDNRYLDKDGYIRLRGDTWKLHPRYTSGGVYEHIVIAESGLGRQLKPDEEVHHRNRKRDDNRPENLEVLDGKVHSSLHGKSTHFLNLDGASGKRGTVTFVPKNDIVKSVVPCGKIDVYDIVMSDPYRNFVANGIIVHNCGKTPATCVAIPANTGVLIVSTRNSKRVWYDHVRWWRPDLKCILLKGKSDFCWPKPGEVLITTYDSLPSFITDDEFYANISMNQFAQPDDWWQGISSDWVDIPENICVISDEIQKVKSPKTTRHRKYKALSNMVQSVGGFLWPLTGSPMMNNPDELWTLLSVHGIAKKAYGSKARYTEIFQDYYAGKRGEEIKIIPEAYEGLRRVSLRRSRADVLSELPGKITNTVLVEDLDKETKRVLDDAWDYVGPILDKMGDDAVNWLQKLMKNKNSEAYEHFMRARHALAIAKIPQMLELVEDFEENNEPCIVYSYHKSPIEILAERPGWEIITGDVSESRRAKIVKDFQAGKLKGIGITVTSGSESITLTKAHNAIFVDLAFNPMTNEQAQDRLDRFGQEKVVVISLMVADHPIDARVTEILTRKKTIITATVDASAVKELPNPVAPYEFLLNLPVKTGKKIEFSPNPRREPISPLEKWAKESLSKIRVFSRLDMDAGSKFLKLIKSGGLTERQWTYAIDICKRYPEDAGKPPESIRGT